MEKVIVVGCGAAGMMAAVTAARRDYEVTIVDGNLKPGRKLLATGNGRCNFTNKKLSIENYRSIEGNLTFVSDLLKSFDNSALIDFFSELGILARDINGYIYPNSEQASSIVEVLMAELRRLKVNVVLGEKIIDIKKARDEFICVSNEKTYYCDYVIITCGGLASPNLGSDGSLFPAIKRLGHSFTKTYPALTALRFRNKSLQVLAGVRAKAKVYLYVNDKFLAADEGEIIFNKDNISGIPIMQLSSLYQKATSHDNKDYILIDFFDKFTEEELYKLISERVNGKYSYHKTSYECLTGMLNNKLLDMNIKEAGINPDKKANTLKPSDINKIIDEFKAMQVDIKEACDYDKAQVMSGGIKLKEIDSGMQSRLVKGLYFAGEVLDVDGMCGGYNLQWAFTTGYIAGNICSYK